MTTPVDFHDVSFVDDLNGWVVGDQGTLLSTRDGGATWSLIDTGVADARSAPKIERIPRNGRVDLIDAGDRTPGLTLGSISFVDRARGWLVGRYAAHGRSLILGTEDGGATWTVEATIRGEDLPALTHSDGALWAVGEHVGDGPQMIYWRRVGG